MNPATLKNIRIGWRSLDINKIVHVKKSITFWSNKPQLIVYYDEPYELVGFSFIFASLSFESPAKLQFNFDETIERDSMFNMLSEYIREQRIQQNAVISEYKKTKEVQKLPADE